MKTVKRILQTIGVICIAAIIIVGIYLSIPPRMLDFCGVVTSVEETAAGTAYHITYVGHSQWVVADAKTKIYPHSDKSATLAPSDIAVGDTIEGDYRWRTEENIARFIRIWE